MKNFFLLLLISIFLISFINAWSYDNSYSYGDASAYIKIMGTFPECDGQKSGNYCVGNYYVDVFYTGDKFYMGYSYTSWSPSSDENGYSGIPLSSDGRKTLPVKNGNPQGYITCAWDRDNAPNGDWAWTSRCGGYLIDTFQNLKIVKCYDNSNCFSTQICDKSGDWTTWSCKIRPLEPITFYRLQNNQCTQISILESEKTINDYSTLQECESHRVIAPPPPPPQTFIEKIWNSIIGWFKWLFGG